MFSEPTRRFRQALQGRDVALSAELALKQDSGAAEIASQAELFRIALSPDSLEKR